MDGHSVRVSSLSWNSYILSSGSRSGQIIHHDVRQRDHLVATLLSHSHEVNNFFFCEKRFPFYQNEEVLARKINWGPYKYFRLITFFLILKNWETVAKICEKSVTISYSGANSRKNFSSLELMDSAALYKNQIMSLFPIFNKCKLVLSGTIYLIYIFVHCWVSNL